MYQSLLPFKTCAGLLIGRIGNTLPTFTGIQSYIKCYFLLFHSVIEISKKEELTVYVSKHNYGQRVICSVDKHSQMKNIHVCHIGMIIALK